MMNKDKTQKRRSAAIVLALIVAAALVGGYGQPSGYAAPAGSRAAISIDPAMTVWRADAGSEPETLMVTATGEDGSADTFSVESSRPKVVAVERQGDAVILTPLSKGFARIIFKGASGQRLFVQAVIRPAATLRLVPDMTTWTASVGDPATVIAVDARKKSGAPDAFTAVSADPSIVAVETNATAVRLTALSAGQTTISVKSDSGIVKRINASVKTGVYFQDDFESGGTDNWDLTPGAGSFEIVEDNGNKVLRYTAGSTSGNVIALLSDAAWAEATAQAGGNLDNYYFEAKIKPLANSATFNKFLYLIGRWQDNNNFYFGGLNVQNSTASTRVELGQNLNGSINRISNTKRPIEINSVWYTVRLEIDGGNLVCYLDGEKVCVYANADFTSGKIGLFTANKSFLIDDVIIGTTADKPASLTLTPAITNWTTNAGEAPLSVQVTALKTDGAEDPFTVESSDPSVVSVSAEDTFATLTPLGEGTATITFKSNSGKVRTITALIGPAFAPGETVYDLENRTDPAAGETGAFVDSALRLTFDDVPQLIPTGMIRIYAAGSGAKADEIKLSNEINWLAFNHSNRYRGIYAPLVKVEGNTVIITPHNGALAYDTEYYVEISDRTISGSINGIDFDGLSKSAGWFFTTGSEPAGNEITVDDDGPSDFRTVQGALNHLMKNSPASGGSIFIKAGVYQEALFLNRVPNVAIKGESRQATIIEYENYDTLNSGTGSSATAVSTSATGGGRSIFLIEYSDMLTLDNLTIKSTHVKQPGLSNQAETIHYNGDGRFIARNCDFISSQDTILTNRCYAWFYNCLIAGDVDFIWGTSPITLFEACEIRTRVDPTSPSSGGYIVQSRSVNGYAGYLFLNCDVTREQGVPDNTAYLARSGASTNYDNVAYINCRMDAHIAERGWFESPLPALATLVRGWKEYGSTDLNGNPLDLEKRVADYAVMLTDEQAATFYPNREVIFSGASDGVNTLSGYPGGWRPLP